MRLSKIKHQLCFNIVIGQFPYDIELHSCDYLIVIINVNILKNTKKSDILILDGALCVYNAKSLQYISFYCKISTS